MYKDSGPQLRRELAAIDLAGEFDVPGIPPADQLLSRLAVADNPQEFRTRAVEALCGEPCFRGESSGQVPEYGARAQPILDGKPDRPVRPAFPGSDHGDASSQGPSGPCDGARVAKTSGQDRLVGDEGRKRRAIW